MVSYELYIKIECIMNLPSLYCPALTSPAALPYLYLCSLSLLIQVISHHLVKLPSCASKIRFSINIKKTMFFLDLGWLEWLRIMSWCEKGFHNFITSMRWREREILLVFRKRLFSLYLYPQRKTSSWQDDRFLPSHTILSSPKGDSWKQGSVGFWWSYQKQWGR